MIDVCILFMYYGNAHREALLQNWNQMMIHNPGVAVVPLLQDGEPSLPNTVDVRGFPTYGWITENGHRSCDTMVYRWFLNRSFDAERYIVYEWDTFATTSVRDFYRPVWDADVACLEYADPAILPDWPWFHETPLLPEELRPKAAGLAPFACSMFSHRALLKMVAAPLIADVFAELRVGTMVNWAGMQVCPMEYARRRISWHPDFIRVSPAPNIYHPVKRPVQFAFQRFRAKTWT